MDVGAQCERRRELDSVCATPRELSNQTVQRLQRLVMPLEVVEHRRAFPRRADLRRTQPRVALREPHDDVVVNLEPGSQTILRDHRACLQHEQTLMRTRHVSQIAAQSVERFIDGMLRLTVVTLPEDRGTASDTHVGESAFAYGSRGAVLDDAQERIVNAQVFLSLIHI